MEHLERLAKVLRYAGLNLTPQIINLILDENVSNLVSTLDTQLKENPKTDLDQIDAIIAEIQSAVEAQEKAEKEKAEAKAVVEKTKKTKLQKV